MIYHREKKDNKQNCAKLIFVTSTFVCLCFHTSYAWAGAWLLPKGKGQSIQTTLYSNAHMGFDQRGKLSQPVRFSKLNSNTYWEYGLSKSYTVILSSNIQDLNYSSGVDSVDFQGFGQTSIAIRRKLWANDTSIISLQPRIILKGPGETISDAILGAGGTQFEMRVLAGKSFKLAQKDGFVDIQTAWRYRPDGFPDEFRFDFTTGWRPHPKIQVLAQTFYANASKPSNLALSRQTKSFKTQVSLVYEKSARTSYQIGTYQTINGQDTIKENAFFLAIWKRY